LTESDLRAAKEEELPEGARMNGMSPNNDTKRWPTPLRIAHPSAQAQNTTVAST
jgi:hypothetical protein